MHAHANANTRFHIDLDWWKGQSRDLGTHLLEILGGEEAAQGTAQGATLDFIDPVTAEVRQLDALWVRVLNERAGKPDYIVPTLPVMAAIFRALVESTNMPMSVTELHRRIGRGSPEMLLRVLGTARDTYGIFPVADAH